MLAITESIAGKRFSDILKDKYNTTIWQYKDSFKYEVVKVSAYWIY